MANSTKEYFENLDPALQKALGEIMKKEKDPERTLQATASSQFINDLIKIINIESKNWNKEVEE